jgi:hypothetical protein
VLTAWRCEISGTLITVGFLAPAAIAAELVPVVETELQRGR